MTRRKLSGQFPGFASHLTLYPSLFTSLAGHSLVEFMIAMTAGAVMLSAAQQSLLHFEHRLYRQQDGMAQQQDARLGLRVLEAELRAAGTGGPFLDPILQAKGQELEFLANLNGQTTTLTAAVAAGQQELKVLDGSGWPKGKRIVVCTAEACAESRLARDGQRFLLTLTGPFPTAMPAGSTVSVLNQVRYYLGGTRSGRSSLMRQVDGAANSLIGEVRDLRITYLDRNGGVTGDPAVVARVRVQVSLADHAHPLVTEIGLRFNR
jgi:hypothetical protein